MSETGAQEEHPIPPDAEGASAAGRSLDESLEVAPASGDGEPGDAAQAPDRPSPGPPQEESPAPSEEPPTSEATTPPGAVPAPEEPDASEVAPEVPGTDEGDADAGAGGEAEAPHPEADVSAAEAKAKATAEAVEEAVPRPRIPWWPFLVYFGVWLGAVGAATWLFLRAPVAASIASEAIYPYTLRAGVVLTALGPLLALTVWLVVWLAADRGRRNGLLASALLKGALFTSLGVATWWIMLAAVDRARFGRLW